MSSVWIKLRLHSWEGERFLVSSDIFKSVCRWQSIQNEASSIGCNAGIYVVVAVVRHIVLKMDAAVGTI